MDEKEYIERGALMSDIDETVIFTVREGAQLPNAEMRGANKVIDRIKAASAADVVEVRHGEWGDTGDFQLDTIYSGWKCSECDFIYCGGKFNYCPHCGAKMDGKGEGANG